MNHSKAPPQEDKDPGDELFDHDYLSNSDSEFLAELDRVLAESGRSDLAPAKQQEAPPTAPAPQSPPAEPESAEPFDLAAPSPDPPALAAEPQTWDDERADSEPLPAESDLDALDLGPDSRDDVDDLDWDELAELSAQPKAPAAAVDWDATDNPAPELTDAATHPGGELPGLPDEPLPQASLQEQPTEAPPAPEPMPVLRNPEPEFAEPSAEPAAAVSKNPPDAPPVTPHPHASDIWSGAAVLLALLGVAGAGAGLWQARSVEDRLLSLESPAPVVGAPPSAAPANPADAAALESVRQEVSRISAGLQSLRSEVPRSSAPLPAPSLPSPQEQELKSQIADVQGRMRTMEASLESLKLRLAQSEQQLTELSDQGAALVAAATARSAGHLMAAAANAERTREGDMESAATPAASAAAKPAAKPPAPSATKPPARPKSGNWSVNLLSFRKLETANQEKDRLRAQGLATEVRTVESAGKTWHRVVVGGFSAFDAAKAFADEVRTMPGLSTAWIARD